MIRFRIQALRMMPFMLAVLMIPCLNQTANSQHVPTWATDKRDLLGEALDSIGWSRGDLGYRPLGYWARYPQVPYKLPFFDSLFSEPMRVYDYTRTMGNAVEKFLDPAMSAQDRRDGIKSPDRMHQLVYFLAIERRVGGFRSYATNLLPRPDEETPILDAIRKVYISADDQLLRTSFGAVPSYPNAETDITDQLKGVKPEFQKIFAECILNALDALQWRNIALRRVSRELQDRVFYIRDFAQTQGDGIIYYPQVDDVAGLIDEQSLAYAAMKLSQATEDCYYALSAYLGEHPLAANFNFETMTPYGRIKIAGKGKDTHAYDDYFILIDLGGNDKYTGPVGATSRPDIGISLCLDLEGNDRYEYESKTCPSQGAGVLGCGILYDAKGDDIYKAKHTAQGVGFFGTGVLYDGDGEDKYEMETSGQGAGFFGHGLAFDSGQGNDSYRIFGEGQGYGGCNGVGVCANWSGDDHYYAEPNAEVVNRGDYHSGFSINVSNAQGVGSGRRGDGTDGHSWAGGLGFIADIRGNDTYEAGNFSLGTGYWFGTGLMYDKEGNDLYKSVYFTQASGAHFCIGAIIDEAGDDVHDLWFNSGAGLAFGWDFAVALLVDKSGNDKYKAYRISIASSQIRSNAFFFDLAGNDEYIAGEDNCVGWVNFQQYDKPHPLSPFYQYCNSIGLFIDAGGEDVYTKWIKTPVEKDESGEKAKSDEPTEIDSFEVSSKFFNNMLWEQPPRGDSTYGYNNFGIGWDIEVSSDEATIPDVTWLDPKPEQKKE